jgi:hypothetical protein
MDKVLLLLFHCDIVPKGLVIRVPQLDKCMLQVSGHGSLGQGGRLGGRSICLSLLQLLLNLSPKHQ